MIDSLCFAYTVTYSSMKHVYAKHCTCIRCDTVTYQSSHPLYSILTKYCTADDSISFNKCQWTLLSFLSFLLYSPITVERSRQLPVQDTARAALETKTGFVEIPESKRMFDIFLLPPGSSRAEYRSFLISSGDRQGRGCNAKSGS